MKILMFYGGQLYGEYSSTELDTIHLALSADITRELRNGCYLYYTERPRGTSTGARWYRGDGTPVLLVDVPTEYRALVLLLI